MARAINLKLLRSNTATLTPEVPKSIPKVYVGILFSPTVLIWICRSRQLAYYRLNHDSQQGCFVFALRRIPGYNAAHNASTAISTRKEIRA